MFLSVILSTYDSPAFLAKVLWGYSVQTYREFEIVVADDGSSHETAACIRAIAASAGLAIAHVWQRHEGFRKCRALNRAILKCRAEYLVFSDGDCVPRNDFLAVHAQLARRNRFLSGGIVRLPPKISEAVARENILSREATNADWLEKQGFSLGWRNFHLRHCGPLAGLVDTFTTTRATFNGHNASCWKEDALAVNGFDERMGYGGLDREFGERLIRRGTFPIQIRHRAVALHLDHPRAYADPEGIAANDRLRLAGRRAGTTLTEYGISQHQAVSASPFLPDAAARRRAA